MGATETTERAGLAVLLMSLEQAKAHKWRRNSQGMIIVNPRADSETLGATCTRCGKWYSVDSLRRHEVEACPPRPYLF